MWKADAHKVWAPVSSSWLGAVWRPSRLLAPAWPHAAVCRVFWQSSWGISHLWCLARVCGLGKQNFTRVVYKGGTGFFSPFIGCSILPSLSRVFSLFSLRVLECGPHPGLLTSVSNQYQCPNSSRHPRGSLWSLNMDRLSLCWTHVHWFSIVFNSLKFKALNTDLPIYPFTAPAFLWVSLSCTTTKQSYLRAKLRRHFYFFSLSLPTSVPKESSGVPVSKITPDSCPFLSITVILTEVALISSEI